MGRHAAWSIGTAALAVAVASCASHPVAEDSTVRFSVATYRMGYPSTDAPFAPRVGLPSVPEPVAGASCTLWNDLGRWTVVTPGVVEVPNSVAALAVECIAPGFTPSLGRVACVSQGMRGWGYVYAGGAVAGYLLAMNSAYGGGSFTKEGAVILGLATATMLYGLSQATGPQANQCRYAAREATRIDIQLEP